MTEAKDRTAFGNKKEEIYGDNEETYKCPDCFQESKRIRMKRTGGNSRVYGEREYFIDADGEISPGSSGRKYDEKDKSIEDLKKPHCPHCHKIIADDLESALEAFG